MTWIFSNCYDHSNKDRMHTHKKDYPAKNYLFIIFQVKISEKQ